MANNVNDDLTFDEIFLIKSKLNREKIKLWLPPYTIDSESKGEIPLEIISRFSKELSLSELTVLNAFEKLRCHAVSKLKAKETFRSTGIATLNFHLIWVSGAKEKEKMDVSLTAKLDEKVSDVCVRLSISLSPHKFSFEDVKLIHKGIILKHDLSLGEQQVVNSGTIMVMLSLISDSLQADDEAVVCRVNETRKVAEALAKRVDAGTGKHDHYFLEISNQKGEKIQLPDEERQSLSVALTLHEKGRQLMKKGNMVEGLLLFLEADQNFSSCRSEILGAVDNYALLCLDIVWCYFSLQKLEQLPDAVERLKKCKECFSKSYGKNMERLTIVKGSDVNELALFTRMHILEAICFYLHEDPVQATTSLNKAEELLKRLQIDDDKFTQLIMMGFSASEARLSLRACRGDVTVAIEYISRRREDENKRIIADEENQKKRKLAKSFGKTAAGALIDVDNLKNLEEMGFSQKKAATALQKCNNDINNALEALRSDPTLQTVVAPEDTVQQYLQMGFDEQLVRTMLEDCNFDPELDFLERLIERSSGQGPSIGQTRTPESSSDEEDMEIDEKVEENMKDVSSSEWEDYLDLTLNEETELVNKYRLLIASLRR